MIATLPSGQTLRSRCDPAKRARRNMANTDGVSQWSATSASITINKYENLRLENVAKSGRRSLDELLFHQDDKQGEIFSIPLENAELENNR